MGTFLARLFGMGQGQTVMNNNQSQKKEGKTSSLPQQKLAYIYKTRDDINAFIQQEGEILNKAVDIAQSIENSRKKGAYTLVLNDKLYDVRYHYKEATGYVWYMIDKIPPVHDQLDHQYFLEALGASIYTANDMRRHCEKLISPTKELVDMLSHFEEHEALVQQLKNEVIPALQNLKSERESYY